MDVPSPDSDKFQLFVHELKSAYVKPAKGMALLSQSDHFRLLNVKVQPVAKFKSLYCWFNAFEYSSMNGGFPIYGWAFWYSERRGYLAQHHAVFRASDGQYLDVTPSETGNKSILFMPDDRVPFDYHELRGPFSFEQAPNGISYWSHLGHRSDQFAIGKISMSETDKVNLQHLQSLRRFGYFD